MTPLANSQAIDLFLLPHQDDEFAIFHIIEASISKGRKPFILYLTDGAFGKASAAERNEESLTVLKKLGLSKNNIYFLGQSAGIGNQKLASNLDTIYIAVIQLLDSSRASRIADIYTTAWEGGHPDHDAAALLASALAQFFCVQENVYQFPLYNSYNCKLRLYSVFNPIHEAGSVIEFPLPFTRRLNYLYYCSLYPSQLVTFIGLAPFIFCHYALKGTQQLQHLNPKILWKRPHIGSLLYERRKWLNWETFEKSISGFRLEYISQK